MKPVALAQRRRGHRFSVDDLATAWEAVRAAPEAQSFLDLRCGIGSVLLMVVVCTGGRHPQRVVGGAAAAGLVPVRRVDIVPRAGRSTLFSVWTCARARRGTLEHTIVVMQDERGERTDASRAMRATFGLDPDFRHP